MLDAVVDVVEIDGVPKRFDAVAAFPVHAAAVVAVAALPLRSPVNV
jgi:hypothetical protein